MVRHLVLLPFVIFVAAVSASPIKSLLSTVGSDYVPGAKGLEICEVEYIGIPRGATISIGEFSGGGGDGEIEIEYNVETFASYSAIYASPRPNVKNFYRYCNSQLKYSIFGLINSEKPYAGNASVVVTNKWFRDRWTASSTTTQIKFEDIAAGQVLYSGQWNSPIASLTCVLNQSIGVGVPSMPLVRFRRFATTGCFGEHEIVSVRFRNENGVQEGAMYDKVTGELYREQGTAIITIGPDL